MYELGGVGKVGLEEWKEKMGSSGVLYMIDEWQRRLDRQGWNVVEMSVRWKKSGEMLGNDGC